jgi:hypothetical protein
MIALNVRKWWVGDGPLFGRSRAEPPLCRLRVMLRSLHDQAEASGGDCARSGSRIGRRAVRSADDLWPPDLCRLAWPMMGVSGRTAY